MPYIKQENRELLDECVSNANKINDIFIQYFEDMLIYISSGGTPWMHKALIPLAKYMKENVKPDGSLNYFLFKYAKYHLEPSYKNYKTFIGKIHIAMKNIQDVQYIDEYRESAEWIRIKLLTPYEFKKIEENGDV